MVAAAAAATYGEETEGYGPDELGDADRARHLDGCWSGK